MIVHAEQFDGFARTRIAERGNVPFEFRKDRLPPLDIYAVEWISNWVGSFRNLLRDLCRGDAVPDVGSRQRELRNIVGIVVMRLISGRRGSGWHSPLVVATRIGKICTGSVWGILRAFIYSPRLIVRIVNWWFRLERTISQDMTASVSAHTDVSSRFRLR